jgi:hypothetical protein
MDRPELLRLARVGAEARLQVLQSEIALILRQFPELHDGRRRRNSSASTPRRKRTMSASARKQIAAAQKNRWAEWRKKQAS